MKQQDWVCNTCQYLNFRWRRKCQRCDEPRPRGFKPGDWFCDAGVCQAHNYANRIFCFRCGTLKSKPFLLYDGCVGGYYNPPPTIFAFPAGQRISRRGWRPGDWFCGRPDCSAHNFGDRVQCFKCNSLRELATNIPNLTSFVASQVCWFWCQ